MSLFAGLFSQSNGKKAAGSSLFSTASAFHASTPHLPGDAAPATGAAAAATEKGSDAVVKAQKPSNKRKQSSEVDHADGKQAKADASAVDATAAKAKLKAAFAAAQAAEQAAEAAAGGMGKTAAGKPDKAAKKAKKGNSHAPTPAAEAKPASKKPAVQHGDVADVADKPGNKAGGVNPAKAKGSKPHAAPHGKQQEAVAAPAATTTATASATANGDDVDVSTLVHESQMAGATKAKKQKQKKSKKAAAAEAAVVDSEGSGDEGPAPVTEGEADAGQDEPSTRKQLTPEEQAEKLQRTIFVGNVPAKKSTQGELKELFSKYGEVQSVRMRSLTLDREAKGSRRTKAMLGKVDPKLAVGNAYVVFKSADSVPGALAANMTQMGNLHMRVDRAAPPKKKDAAGAERPQFDPVRSIFLGNVHFMAQDEELISLFSDKEVATELEGSVEAVRVVRDGATNIGKGFAFVLFKTKAAARAALHHTPWLLRKKTLRVTKVSQSSKTTTGKFAYRPAPTKPLPAASPSRTGTTAPGPRGGAAAAAGQLPQGSAGGAAGKPPGRQFSVQGSAKADWQGVRTKGKEKGVRGPKAEQRPPRPGVKGPKAKAPDNRKRDGKRPSVANRKAKAKPGNAAQAPSPSQKGKRPGQAPGGRPAKRFKRS